MSAVALPPPYCQYASQGVSNESQAIEAGLFQLKAHRRLAVSQSGVDSLKSQLIEVGQECSAENWDNYGAKKIASEAVAAALCLADLLPEGIVEPEPVPEPSGNLGMEWINLNGSRFLMTPLPEGLIYAGVFGQTIIHGQVNVTHELPKEIISNLLQYFSKG